MLHLILVPYEVVVVQLVRRPMQRRNNLYLFFRYAETEVQPVQRVFDVVQKAAIRNVDNVVQLLNRRRALCQEVEFA